MTPFFLHSALVVYYVFFFIYATFIFVPPPHMVRDNFMDSLIAGPGQFLTTWNMVLQTVYFCVALLNDIVGSNDCAPSEAPFIRRMRDYIFCTLVFPTTLFIGILFWSLITIDRELIFPKIIEEFFSPSLNHVMHTNVVVFIILETFSTFHQYPSVKDGLTSLTILFASYFIWMLTIYFYAGLWVYPVLDILSWPWRIIFLLSCMVKCYVCYFAGEFLNGIIWAKHKSHLQSAVMKKCD